MSRIGMTSISWSFQGFFKIKLGRDFSTNAVAHDKTGIGNIPQNDLVLPRHLVRNPRSLVGEIVMSVKNPELLKLKNFLLLFSLAFPANQTELNLRAKFKYGRERVWSVRGCVIGFWRGFDSGGQIKLFFSKNPETPVQIWTGLIKNWE